MFRPLATSTLALVLGAAPALAEVTPAQVWDNLRQSYEDMGYQVQVGSENAAGSDLTLNDVSVTHAVDAGGEMRFLLPSLVLTQTGGGDVRTVIDGQMTIEMRADQSDEDKGGFVMTLDAPGNETLSSGTPEAMEHRVNVPTMTLAGRALDDENEVPVTMTVTGIEGTQAVTRDADGAASHRYDATAEALEMQITATGPALSQPEAEPQSPAETPSEATESFAATIRIADLAMEGTSARPQGAADFNTDPAAALEAGFDARGRFTMGQLGIDFQSSTVDETGTSEASGTIGASAGELAVAMSSEGLSYDGNLTDMQTRLSSDGMPFPIAYAATRNAFGLSVPVTVSDAPQPFSLRYVLEGLTLDDALWQAFDPQSTLPRDPASLTVDLEGEAVVTRNILAEDAATPPEDGAQAAPMPLLPRRLVLRDVSLDAIGAQADMSGELSFGDDPTQPVGTIQGTFSGINGLLDNLVAMGVVPQDQLMGPRMMMAMFARPVEGNPDQLQTELEFLEDGSILANGQRVR